MDKYIGFASGRKVELENWGIGDLGENGAAFRENTIFRLKILHIFVIFIIYKESTVEPDAK